MACEPPPPVQNPSTLPSEPAQISSFSLAPESLQVDKIGLRDGNFRPDGSMDLAFLARVKGPARALFIASANAKCEPNTIFRANTSVDDQPSPPELGGTLELGRMSGGIAVEERGKIINSKSGEVRLGPGVHDLKLYVPNLGTLKDGETLCLFAIGGDGVLIRSSPMSYQ